VQVDTSDPDFISRFWAAYWQGRELVRRAYPPDGWPERMDADLGPVKRTKAMAPSAWFWLVGLLLFCALFMHGATRVGWLLFIAVGVLVELAVRRWHKRKGEKNR
jgi:hypothetical protein